MTERQKEQQWQFRIKHNGVSEPRGKLTSQMLGTEFYSSGIPKTNRMQNKSIVTTVKIMLLSLEGQRITHQ